MTKTKLPKNIFMVGNKYLVRKQYDGKRISITLDTLSEAVQKVNELNEMERRSMTLSGDDIVNKFFYEHVIPEREKIYRESTVQQNIDLYKKHVEKSIGKKNLIAVTENDIKVILNDLEKNNKAYNTVKAVKRIISILFNMAKEKKLIAVNPVSGITLTKNANTAVKNRTCKGDDNKAIEMEDVLDLKEVKEFLEMAKDSNYYNVYLLALKTGLRYGEICGLEWKDIDYKKKKISIRGSLYYSRKKKGHYIGPPKTASSYRTLPISDGIMKILEQQKTIITENRGKYGDVWTPKEKNLKNLVFYCLDGSIIYRYNLSKDLKMIENKLIEKYGVSKHLHMHLFRHTFATLGMEEEGISLRMMQKLLGHANPEITMKVYWKLLSNKEDEAMNWMDDLF